MLALRLVPRSRRSSGADAGTRVCQHVMPIEWGVCQHVRAAGSTDA